MNTKLHILTNITDPWHELEVGEAPVAPDLHGLGQLQQELGVVVGAGAPVAAVGPRRCGHAVPAQVAANLTIVN